MRQKIAKCIAGGYNDPLQQLCYMINVLREVGNENSAAII